MGTGRIGFTIGTSKTTHDLREQGITRTGSDITVAGSQIWAGQDVRLDAARDVNLLAAQDTQQTTGKTAAAAVAWGSVSAAAPAATASASSRM